MSRLLFFLRTSVGVMDRHCCEDLEMNDTRGIRAHARAMAEQAVKAGADIDDLTVQVVHEEPAQGNAVVASLNCHRLANSPI